MRRPAFTFLELLVAISLFSVGILSVLKLFPVDRRYLTQSADTTQAAYLAQEEIETVKTVTYANLTVGAYESLHHLDTSSGSPFYQYQRQTVVSYIDGTWQASATDRGLKKVDVSVFWTEHGVSRQYNLSTYVHQSN